MTSFVLLGRARYSCAGPIVPAEIRRKPEQRRRNAFRRHYVVREGAMKRQWRIHRQLRTATDGAQRWDQAYQLLLECTRIQASPDYS